MSGAVALSVLAATSTSVVDLWIREAVAGRDVLPALSDVQAAAVEALELVPSDDAETWASRARRRGLVPDVQVRFGSDSELDVRDTLSLEAARVRVEGRGIDFDASARWELGDLIFSDAELRANREHLARAAAVRLARERATRIYFERVRVLVLLRIDPTALLLLEAARLDGLLEALTGGLLSRRSSSPRVGPSPRRSER